MSVLTAAIDTGTVADPGPMPWRRMTWVVWRQHRFALAGVVTLLVAVGVYLWIAGSQLHDAYAAMTACRPAGSPACLVGLSDFTGKYDHAASITPALLQVLPALIGAFVGAPELARELESGTFRYAWTQGFGRGRWTIAKLVPLALVVFVAAGLFSLLFDWYYQPFIADGQANRLAAFVFDLRGVAFPSWTLAAFAVGGLAGVLIRRVVPALIAALTAYTGLALAVGILLRPHYMTPMTTSRSNVPASALVTNSWGTRGGRVAFTGRAPVDLLQQLCPPSAVGSGKPSSGAFAECLSRHGYTLWTSYQPSSRYWPFQLIESGWLIALSTILIATTVWLVRRRAA